MSGSELLFNCLSALFSLSCGDKLIIPTSLGFLWLMELFYQRRYGKNNLSAHQQCARP